MEDMSVTIMVDLDMLIDTRLGVMVSQFGVDPSKVIPDTTYRHRISDAVLPELVGIDGPKFRSAMKPEARDLNKKDIIQNSMVTNLGLTLPRVLANSLASTSDWEIMDSVKIIINTYPYQLTSEEREILAWGVVNNGLKKWPEIIKVTAEYHPYSSLTSGVLDVRRIDGLYLYDIAAWVEAHKENWKNSKNHHHRFQIVAPRLGNPDVLKSRDPGNEFAQTKSFYNLTGIMTLEWIDTDAVCAVWHPSWGKETTAPSSP